MAAGTALGLVIMLALTGVVLGQGVLLKRSCATGDWADGRQYRHFCYSDIVPLYGSEQLSHGRLPYVDACEGTGDGCDEYPVLTMYLMRAAAAVGRSYAGFFYANVVLLGLMALTTVWLLYRMVGTRAVYFALAPTLAIYAFVNWDLLAVFLATAGTFLFLRNRNAESGALLGLGTAAKLYPGLLVVPFGLDRIRRRQIGEGILIAVWAGVTWVAVNLPFAVLAPGPWSTFFRFNAHRPADWDSLWFVVCQRLEGGTGCGWSSGLINAGSAVAFVAVAAVVWFARRARDPEFPAWTFAFPLLVAFLLTGKVYSPQYSLWLLPWFALALPSPGLFIAFELADVAVFLTRFSWFGRLSADMGDPGLAGYRGVPLGGFEIAVLVRAVILVLCLVAWVRRTEDEPVAVSTKRPVEPAGARSA
ncbi:MAG TPA: glycosyltransferase 87 family protein [Actinomycetota bacterium]|nr:glycosyltransferase 87 family protein [Actinomycetota bacterium]